MDKPGNPVGCVLIVIQVNTPGGVFRSLSVMNASYVLRANRLSKRHLAARIALTGKLLTKERENLRKTVALLVRITSSRTKGPKAFAKHVRKGQIL